MKKEKFFRYVDKDTIEEVYGINLGKIGDFELFYVKENGYTRVYEKNTGLMLLYVSKYPLKCLLDKCEVVIENHKDVDIMSDKYRKQREAIRRKYDSEKEKTK